jgi:hypothetical protein
MSCYKKFHWLFVSKRLRCVSKWILSSFVSIYMSMYLSLVLAVDIDRKNNTIQVNFEQEQASPDTKKMANWIIDTGDNRNLPFVIIDKQDAKVFVFHPDGRLHGAAPALLGLSHGDDTISGIGERKLSTISPFERTTPSGRFVATLDHNLHGEEILWVDYKTGISLHRVHNNNAQEQRVHRLSTPTPLDNRISFGCINVPVDFYTSIVSKAFTATSGIVYILPETRTLHEVFGLNDDVNEYALSPTESKH